MTRLLLGVQGSGQLVGALPDPGVFAEAAQLAERAGFDSIWAGDHVSFENPILDVTVALSTFAAVTSRIAIGSGIVLLPLRPPALVAKAFSTLDYLSNGRVVVGVGAGGEGLKDFESVGVPVHERRARLEEAMGVLRALFAAAPASFTGRFTQFEGVSVEPLPSQAGGPPLWVGGRSPAALRTAGRLGDGWLPIWVSTEAYAAGWAEVRRHADAAGRDADALTPAAVVPALVDDDGDRARREARDHLERRYATGFSEHAIARYCVAGTPDECAARVQAYTAAGVRHLVFNPVVPADRLLEQIERLADAVAVRA